MRHFFVIVALISAGCNTPAREADHAATSEPRTSEPRTPNLEPRTTEITLTPDMIQRAGIKTVAAMKGAATTSLHLPGVVQPVTITKQAMVKHSSAFDKCTVHSSTLLL